MATILPRKTPTEFPVAKDDEIYTQLVTQGDVTPRYQSVSSTYGPASINNQPLDPNAAAPVNAANNAVVLVDNTNTSWINNKWRPTMGWVYMATCVCDFILFPILWSILQAIEDGSVVSQWKPLTLQGAGLYHIAMGAVLGIAAYGRTQEKIASKTPVNS